MKQNYLKRKLLFLKNKIFTYIYERHEFIIGDLHRKITQGQKCTQKGKKTNMILKFNTTTCTSFIIEAMCLRNPVVPRNTVE